ncbi:MAG: sulfatase-like hydrolase/transferase, partial [Saprospiraceae bacterium]|nr:sulfatase-like hydrolase/transferase [Saprospiraceae bacterium]
DQPYTMAMRPLMDEIIQNKSIDYIEKHKNDDDPFFLYIPWTAMHHPYVPHSDFKGSSQNGEYADMMREHDYRVGQVIKSIRMQV